MQLLPKSKCLKGLLLIVCLMFLMVGCEEINTIDEREPNKPNVTLPSEQDVPVTDIKIANWNVQTFGTTKWSNPAVKQKLLEVIPIFDIIFIQEIRDSTNTVFPELCDALKEEYACAISSRAGRTNSKEQYGVIYNKNIELVQLVDYNLQQENNQYWERPPVEVQFKYDEYYFTIYNIHIKPDDASNELKYLEEKTSDSGNVIWLGDFNADGDYYDEDQDIVFLDDKWVIEDSEDTTVAASSNTYDRIILNKDMYQEYASHGIYTDITSEISDHYPVWVEIRVS